MSTLFIPHQSSEAPAPAEATPSAQEVPESRPAPRPMNSWLIFRAQKVRELKEQEPDARVPQAILSKIVSELWKNESPQVKKAYEKMAEERKIEHDLKNPAYKYAPRAKTGTPKARKTSSTSAAKQKKLSVDNPSSKARSRTQPRPNSLAGASSFPVENYTPYHEHPAIPLSLPSIASTIHRYSYGDFYGSSHNNNSYNNFPTLTQDSRPVVSRSQAEINSTWSMLESKLDVSMPGSTRAHLPYSNPPPGAYFPPSVESTWDFSNERLHSSRDGSFADEEVRNESGLTGIERRWRQESVPGSSDYESGYGAGWTVDQSPVFAPSMIFSSSSSGSTSASSVSPPQQPLPYEENGWYDYDQTQAAYSTY